MTKRQKIFVSIFLILFLGLFVFTLSWTVINWDKVKVGMSGTALYTKEDLDNACAEVENQHAQEKAEYEKLINEYRDKILILNDNLTLLNSDIQKKETKIVNLEILILIKESRISELEKLSSENEQTLIENLAEIERLKSEILDYQNEVDDLLQKLYYSELEKQSLEKEISNLKQDLTYYENFIAGLETSSQAVATFVYNKTIYSILLLQKGSTIAIADPVDTDYIKFLGWLKDNESVDFNTYVLDSNVTFIADLEYSYDVKYLVDDEQYYSQIVKEYSYSSIPSDPVKAGYIFEGWTVNGIDIVDPSICPISSETTFIAKFTKVHTVILKVDGNVVSTQSVKNNGYVEEITENISDYIQINYWMINGEKINLSTYPITEDLVIEANFTRKYDVKFMYELEEYDNQIILENSSPTMIIPEDTTFKRFKGWSLDKETIVDIESVLITEDTIFYAVIEYSYAVEFYSDESIYDTQIIVENNKVLIPANPTKEGYAFEGWTKDGNTVEDLESIQITEDTIFIAKFVKLFTATFKYNGGVYTTQTIKNGEYPTKVVIEDTDTIKFNGWTINGTDIIDETSCQITEDITFIANLTYFYKVDFVVNDSVIYSSYIEQGQTTDYAGSVEVGDYDITGWTLDGSSVTVSSCTITADTTFIATVKRVRVTVTGNRSTAYSVTDNWSSAGVYIIRFSVPELMSFTSANSADFVFTYGYTSGTVTYSGNSSGTIELSSDGKVGLSVSGGGISIYIYDEYYLDADFNVVLTPVYKGISGL